MKTDTERIGTLEMRVERLETWAGPGQADALAAGMRGVRAELAVMRRVQDQHTAMLNGLKADVRQLKADVSELKADMSGVKLTLAEILRRLPPAPAPG